MKKLFIFFLSIIVMIVAVGCGDDNNSNCFMTPEQFQKKYNDNLMIYLRKNLNNEQSVKTLYEQVKITNIEYLSNENFNNILFRMNERLISIESLFFKKEEKYLKNITICKDRSTLHNEAYWQAFCVVAVVAAHSFNEKSNSDETDSIIRNLTLQLDNGNLNPSITIDDISYTLGPMLTINPSLNGVDIKGANITTGFNFVKIINDNNSSKINQSKQESKVEKPKVNQNTSKKVDNKQYKEIFVGKSDVTGRACYLLTDSIKVYNNKQNLDCTIKMVKSGNDVQYLNYKFKRENSILMFETNQGFRGKVDINETPIEYQTYATAIRSYDGMQQHSDIMR